MSNTLALPPLAQAKRFASPRMTPESWQPLAGKAAVPVSTTGSGVVGLLGSSSGISKTWTDAVPLRQLPPDWL
jgi:hypothetical protein